MWIRWSFAIALFWFFLPPLLDLDIETIHIFPKPRMFIEPLTSDEVWNLANDVISLEDESEIIFDEDDVQDNSNSNDKEDPEEGTADGQSYDPAQSTIEQQPTRPVSAKRRNIIVPVCIHWYCLTTCNRSGTTNATTGSSRTASAMATTTRKRIMAVVILVLVLAIIIGIVTYLTSTTTTTTTITTANSYNHENITTNSNPTNHSNHQGNKDGGPSSLSIFKVATMNGTIPCLVHLEYNTSFSQPTWNSSWHSYCYYIQLELLKPILSNGDIMLLVDPLDLYLTRQAIPTLDDISLPASQPQKQDNHSWFVLPSITHVSFPFPLPDAFNPNNYNGVMLVHEDSSSSPTGSNRTMVAMGTFQVVEEMWNPTTMSPTTILPVQSPSWNTTHLDIQPTPAPSKTTTTTTTRGSTRRPTQMPFSLKTPPTLIFTGGTNTPTTSS